VYFHSVARKGFSIADIHPVQNPVDHQLRTAAPRIETSKDSFSIALHFYCPRFCHTYPNIFGDKAVCLAWLISTPVGGGIILQSCSPPSQPHSQSRSDLHEGRENLGPIDFLGITLLDSRQISRAVSLVVCPSLWKCKAKGSRFPPPDKVNVRCPWRDTSQICCLISLGQPLD
jgi:hypothetical protein